MHLNYSICLSTLVLFILAYDLTETLIVFYNGKLVVELEIVCARVHSLSIQQKLEEQSLLSNSKLNSDYRTTVTTNYRSGITKTFAVIRDLFIFLTGETVIKMEVTQTSSPNTKSFTGKDNLSVSR